MRLKLTGPHVLAKRTENKKETAGGIIIPEDSRTKSYNISNRAIVIEVGPGLKTKKGRRIPIDVKEGDEIMFPGYAGIPVPDSLYGPDHLLIHQEDLLVR